MLHTGEELLLAPFWRRPCVNNRALVFVPSGAPTVDNPRTPASHPCVRFPARGRRSAGCCGRRTSTSVGWQTQARWFGSSTQPVPVYHIPALIFLWSMVRRYSPTFAT